MKIMAFLALLGSLPTDGDTPMPVLTHCDYITRHGICIINTTDTRYSQEDIETTTTVTLAQANAPDETLAGMVVMIVDTIGDPRIRGLYIHQYRLIKVRPLTPCLPLTAFPHELVHAIEYAMKGIIEHDLAHRDPFYWAGYHLNDINEPWGVTARAGRISTDLLCR